MESVDPLPGQRVEVDETPGFFTRIQFPDFPAFTPDSAEQQAAVFSQQLEELALKLQQRQVFFPFDFTKALLDAIPDDPMEVVKKESENVEQEEDAWESDEPQLDEDDEAVDSTSLDPAKPRRSRRSRHNNRLKVKKDPSVLEPEPTEPEVIVQTGFWNTVEDFFRPLTDTDFALLTVQQLTPADPVFEIPALGVNETPLWDDEDYEPSHKKKHRKASRQEHPKVAEDELFIGDFTKRVLSCLVAEGVAAVPEFVKPTKEEPLIENDAPMENYNQDHWINFEERVRMELRALGLLEPDVVYIPPSERQDDEICAELRVLHQQLRREVETNNKKRLLFAHLVQQKQIQQEEEKKMLIEAKKVEQRYKAMIRKKRKRNK